MLGLLVLSLLLSASPPAYAQESPVYVIDLHGEINRSMMVYLRRGIGRAAEAGADVIVFDVDTFGGRVDSALQITSLIGAAEQTTVAYVTAGPDVSGVSWSAGALISFACNRIFMAPGTSMGAAAPVYQSAEGMQMAPEKVVSPLRAQMAALAEKNGYPRGVALAMVDQDVELWEAYVSEEMRVVTGDEYADLERLAKKDSSALEKGRLISKTGKLLTLTAGEMERYRVSSGTISTLDQLLTELGVSADPEIRRFEPSAADESVAILTGSALTTLLIVAGLVALFMEITTPGFGIPGTVAVVCFAVVFLSNSLLGTAGSLEILLFVVGVVLLLLEVFIIPGFGVTGVSGIVFIGAALVLSRQDFFVPEFDWQWDLLKQNLLIVFAGVGIAFVAFAIAARFLPQIGPMKSLLLSTSQRVDEGFVVQTQESVRSIVGQRGVAVTTLRPSGKADLNGEIVVVESDGEFVEAGTSVEVVEATGNHIVVRRC